MIFSKNIVNYLTLPLNKNTPQNKKLIKNFNLYKKYNYLKKYFNFYLQIHTKQTMTKSGSLLYFEWKIYHIAKYKKNIITS